MKFLKVLATVCSYFHLAICAICIWGWNAVVKVNNLSDKEAQDIHETAITVILFSCVPMAWLIYDSRQNETEVKKTEVTDDER